MPPVLRTFAVLASGVQVGGSVSIPMALAPLVAIALTEPACVVHVAIGSAFRVAFAKAPQEPNAIAAALLPWLALTVAVAATPVVSQFQSRPSRFARLRGLASNVHASLERYWKFIPN